MNKTVKHSTAAVVIGAVLMLSGCASIEKMRGPEPGPEKQAPAPSEAEKTAGLVRPEKPDTLPSFEHEYTREGLIKALVQFQEYSALAETLQSYLWGDRIFEDHLATIAWLDSGPYDPGRAVRLAVYNEKGERYAEISRGLVEEVPGKGRWWRFSYKSGDTDFTCEYFTDLNAVPRRVLLKNNASGEKISREPFYTEMLAESESPGSDARQSGSGKASGSKEEPAGDTEPGSAGKPGSAASAPPAWFDQLRREEYQAGLNPLYAGMQVLGEEAQLIDGRWIRAVHMRSGSGANALHAWFSPDVRGRLLRIKRSDDHVIAEVVEQSSNFESHFQR